MSIEFYHEDVSLPALDYVVMKKVLKYKLRIDRRKLGTINYIFCSDDYLLDLNIKFLNHNYYTDVITFDYSENSLISGDIYISIDRVRNNAIKFEQGFVKELVRVVSHGLLHLLKYDDKVQSDILIMREMESMLVDRYIFLKDA